MSKQRFVQGCGNAFKDLGFSDVESKSLLLRAQLINLLIYFIQKNKLTQKEAALNLGVTQPRISNLVHGRIDLFSTGMLLDMLDKAGFPIYQKIKQEVLQITRKYGKINQPHQSSDHR